MNLVKTNILGVGVTNETEDNTLEYVINSIQKTSENYFIVTPNPEIVVYSAKHKQFSAILNNARLALCDGTGLLVAGIIMGRMIRQRVTGVGFMFNLCKMVSDINSQHKEKPITVGFLGGGTKIAERAAECLLRENPGLRVVFADQEWPGTVFSANGAEAARGNFPGRNTRGPVRSSFPASARSECSRSNNSLRAVGSPPVSAVPRKPFGSIDILFVAFGFPKQEEWMAKQINKIPVRVMIGVGGAFDYVSGNISRAPFVVRLFGFEWLWRLIREPWRFKRQLALLEFVFLVLKERMFGKA